MCALVGVLIKRVQYYTKVILHSGYHTTAYRDRVNIGIGDITNSNLYANSNRIGTEMENIN